MRIREDTATVRCEGKRMPRRWSRWSKIDGARAKRESDMNGVKWVRGQDWLVGAR